MMMTTKVSCLCGQAAHELALPQAQLPLKAYMCHCDSCRHMTGTLCWSVAFLPASHPPSQHVLDRLRSFQYSPRITLYFCPTCGSKIACRVERNPRNGQATVEWGLSTGTLELADGPFAIMGHEHVQDTLDGGFAEFLPTISNKHIPCWSGQHAEGQPLSLPWMVRDRAEPSHSEGGGLKAYCKCGGVAFWIARPSQRSADAAKGTADASSGPGLDAWWLYDNRTKYRASVCGCNSCRLASGMDWVEWAFVPTVDIFMDAECKEPLKLDAGTLVSYRSSEDVKRYFCSVCGAMVFYDAEDRQYLKDIAVGLFDSPEGARAESWFWWTTGPLSSRQEILARAKSLAEGVEDGLKAYEQRRRQVT